MEELLMDNSVGFDSKVLEEMLKNGIGVILEKLLGLVEMAL